MCNEQNDNFDELYEACQSNTPESRLQELESGVIVLIEMLIENGVIDKETFLSRKAKFSSHIDQMNAAIKERFYKENPGAAFLNELLGGDST